MARVYCSNEITQAHVLEAKRLLSNSIIKIERNDLEIDVENENTYARMELEKNFIPKSNIIEQEIEKHAEQERRK